MSIAENTVVQFHYTLRHGEELIDTSTGGESATYLHGHSNIVPGLEKVMEGKDVGAAFDAFVPCAEGYGERHENSTQQMPIKHLQGAKRWTPGMIAMVKTEKGMRQVTIVKAGLKHATVDLNHPLAGKDLTFSIEIIAIRDGTAEEIAHGYSHGDDAK